MAACAMDLEAYPRQIARSQRYTLGVPRSFTIAPDRDAVAFLRTRGGEDPVSCLWLLEGGEERLLADPARLGWAEEVPAEERVRRDRVHERSRGIVRYSADAGLSRVAFVLDGRPWLLDVRADAGGAGAAVPLPAAGAVIDVQLDPTGERFAYLAAGGVRIAAVAGDEVLAVEPENPDVVYGLSDYTDMAGAFGYWWAPDGGALLLLRTDTERVERIWIADPSEPRRQPRQVAYPLAGTPNPDLSLHVVHLDGRRTEVRWDREAFEYLCTAGWDAHGVLCAVESRDQRRLRVLAGDPASGRTEVLHEATDAAWVSWPHGTPRRTAGGRLVLAGSVGDDLALLVDGEAVTPAGVQVREVLDTDGESVLFVASAEPTEEHLWLWRAGAGTARPLTDEPGLHRAERRGGAWVRTTHDEAGQRAVATHPQRPDVPVVCLQAEPLVAPRVSWLRIGERQIRTALVLPSWYVPGERRLPVLMNPYGGPAVQRVLRARLFHLCEAQWFAEQGFAVLTADGSGTGGRGMAWEREVHGDSLTSVLADQVAALQGTAEEHPDLDLARVGIRGWSFGGTLAAAAVLRRPDVFHCAVSGAAPSEAALYSAHWRERFLGRPQDNPEGYRRGSTLCEAAGLQRPILFVHGLTDDNVLVAHTLRMSAALFAAGKEHELVLLPGTTHMTTDEEVSTRLLLRQLDFLSRHLSPAAPPPLAGVGAGG